MESIKISSGGNCDFISRLPDPILHQILGLLKIEEAVQTCVLSKRWEHLWTSLPSLNFHFDSDNFVNSGSTSYDVRLVERRAIFGRFVKFVTSLLMRRQSLDLDVFHLFSFKLWPDYIGYERGWVRYAVNHNPRVIHLTIACSIPWCVYTCSSLEELYLSARYTDSYTSDQIVNLPKLRKLTICGADDLDSIYVKNLLSGCPILEYLRVDGCRVCDCVIAHECLKHLIIVMCYIFEGVGEVHLSINAPNLLSFFSESCEIDEEVEFHLSINAPNLLSFFYEGKLSSYKTTLNMPSLTSSCLMSQDETVSTSLEGMATCLRFLSNVELLELHFKCLFNMELPPLTVLPLELPIFQKLENVTVTFCMFSCIQMVIWILKSSPNLKKLTILQQEGCKVPDKAGARRNELTNASSMIAVSPCKKLEIIEIKYCEYNKMIRRLVDTLMDGTKEFKNLKIHLWNYKSSMEYLRSTFYLNGWYKGI